MAKTPRNAHSDQYSETNSTNSKLFTYKNIITATGVIVGTSLLAIYWYRKYTHKEKVYNVPKTQNELPGPILTDLENGHLNDMMKSGSLHQYLMKLTNEYGPIGSFFWGKTRMSYITSNRVLMHQDNRILQKLHIRPTMLFEAFQPLIGKHSIQLCNDSNFWNRYHKVMIASFGQKILNTQIPKTIFMNNLNSIRDKLISQIKNNNNVINDFLAVCFLFTSKSIIQLCFGENIDEKLCSNIADGYSFAWHEMEERLIKGNVADSQRETQFQDALNLMKDSVLQIVDNAMNNKDKNSFFLNNCLSNKKLYPTKEHIFNDAITIVTGGTHTTATTLTWVLYYICVHPNIQQKMYQEIVKNISDDTNELSYCQNVIYESHRISCLAPWAARINPDSDMILNNCEGKKVKIKKNTQIIIGLGCALNDEKLWKTNDLNVFNPDRWNDKNLDTDKVKKNLQTLIFGGLGGRICPGYKLAKMEALMFLKNMIQTFHFKLYDQKLQSKLKPYHGLLTVPDSPIKLTVSVR